MRLITKILLLGLILLVLPNFTVSANNETTNELYLDKKENIPLDHVFTITFNDYVDPTSVNEKLIRVHNEDTNTPEKISVKVNASNSKQVTVYPPENGYKGGGSYLIAVNKDFKSKNGSPLTKHVGMKFNTESNNVYLNRKVEDADEYKTLKNKINSNEISTSGGLKKTFGTNYEKTYINNSKEENQFAYSYLRSFTEGMEKGKFNWYKKPSADFVTATVVTEVINKLALEYFKNVLYDGKPTDEEIEISKCLSEFISMRATLNLPAAEEKTENCLVLIFDNIDKTIFGRVKSLEELKGSIEDFDKNYGEKITEEVKKEENKIALKEHLIGTWYFEGTYFKSIEFKKNKNNMLEIFVTHERGQVYLLNGYIGDFDEKQLVIKAFPDRKYFADMGMVNPNSIMDRKPFTTIEIDLNKGFFNTNEFDVVNRSYIINHDRAYATKVTNPDDSDWENERQTLEGKAVKNGKMSRN